MRVPQPLLNLTDLKQISQGNPAVNSMIPLGSIWMEERGDVRGEKEGKTKNGTKVLGFKNTLPKRWFDFIRYR